MKDSNAHSTTVCVVIPIYKEKADLTAYEEISLKQCFKILCNHPIYYIGPKHLDWQQYTNFSQDLNCKVEVKVFADEYFSDLGGYSRLLVNREFYKSFAGFNFMLIHQTDAFVFNDNLRHFCELGYDYIGAPWFQGFNSTNYSAPFISGGNGGFSLRKIETHLKVLNSFSYINRPAENWQQRISQKLSTAGYVREVCGFLLDLFIRNNTYWLLNSFRGFEDQFWCLVAARNFSWFKIPDYEEAMNFAIEMQPRRIFDINNHRLPFGCHAWWKYDLDFWKPYITGFGYKL